jgi:phosphoribosylamine---glycine ligase
MSNLTVLVIDNGARGDVISHAYEASSQVKKVIVSPGHDFIKYRRQKEVLTDFCDLKRPKTILKLARKYKPDLIDVAQDDALAAGTVDLLEKNGFRVFGPKRKPSRIEWDKEWSREFMQRNNILQPRFRSFNQERLGKDYVKDLYLKEPEKIIYVKASGLCLGKGALKSRNLDEAIINIGHMKDFGKSGKIFLIEEGLDGEEFSYYAISDGDHYQIFKSAQDNKKSLNFDQGDQTGGMGANSPALVTEPFSNQIEEQFIAKAINGMNKENIPYTGILYLGGIITDNIPMNIEFNARWGDPECQVILLSIKTDYIDIIMACLDKKLDKIKIKQDNKTRICIVGASRGYPNDYKNVIGKRIYGLEKAAEMNGISVFGSGIKINNGKFYANGGRLFSIVAEGKNILEAKEKAYSAISNVNIEGNNLHYRTDIGWRDIERFLKGQDRF